jgi:tetratricopeptide (TPR) repeat protein
MPTAVTPITIRFRRQRDDTFHLELAGQAVGEQGSPFTPPYDPEIWSAIRRALAPGFDRTAVSPAIQSALQPLGDPAGLPRTVGAALAEALLADETVRIAWQTALGLAERAGRPLPVELRFDDDCAAIAALPWELLHDKGRFLVADSSIALYRYPTLDAPPMRTLAELPLRVLLALAEPVDADPILPQEARRALLHGLRALDEKGAVIVDVLRPPTYNTLVEAVTNGRYQMLVFYGHGAHGDDGGALLFEDEFGGRNLVPAEVLGRALRNSGVRLALLGACESAVAGGDIWQGVAGALVRAGVPLALGMQTTLPVDAALAFIRQFALSLAGGKPVIEAVADGRKPLNQPRYQDAWFIPALYGRPRADTRLVDPEAPLPPGTAELRARMKAQRAQIAQLEQSVTRLGMATEGEGLAQLRRARRGFVETRAQLARRAPGGYAAVTSPLYGVPSNPVFVGRGEELIAVSRHLRGEQPVVIWGAGGIGKSALAIEIAHRQSWRFPAGVLWLDSRGGPTLHTLLDTMGAFCGLDMGQVAPERKAEAVRLALARLDGCCLLVWDNAEELWWTGEGQANRPLREWLRGLPSNCQSLLTTRRDPEQAMWATVEIRPLDDSPMTDLFYRLGSRAGVKIGDSRDRELIPRIIAWLHGHPMALQLVVPLAKRRGLRRVWRDLQKRPLKGIDAAFAASYGRLTTEQQQLFARLSVFAIPFAWEAAEALAPDLEEPDELLDVLVQRALIAFDGARHSYHSLLRQYAYEKLGEAGEGFVRETHRRAAAHLRQKLTETEEGGAPAEALAEIDQWEQAAAWETMAQRAGALVGSLDRLGYWGEIMERLERALQATRAHLETPSKREASLLQDMGILTWKQGEWERAIDFYQQSLETKEQVGDIHGMAQTMGNLGNVYQAKGEWERAIEVYRQSLEALEQVGDIHGMAGTYNNLGAVYQAKGEWDRAIDFYRQSLETFEGVGDIHGMAGTYNNLGAVYQAKGEWERAIDFYRQSLETFEGVGDIHGMAGTYNNLGAVYQAKGEWERAIEVYQQSLETKEQVGDIHGMAQTYNNLGLVYQDKGEWERAIDFYRQSLETFEGVGDIHGMAQTYTNLGNVYQAKGEWERAIDFYQKDLEISEQVGDIHGMAQTLGNLGNVYGAKGEWDRAIDVYRQSLETKEQVGDIHGMAQTYNNLGNVYKDKGEWERAIDFYQQSLETFEQVGDIHGMAGTWTNMGILYLQTERGEEAKPLLVQAFLVFQQMGSPHADTAANGLVQACGSVDGANAYLVQFTEEGGGDAA